MTVRAAILGRVSGHKQKKEKTIEMQVAVCEAYCRKNGFKVIGRYLDQNVRSIVPTEDRPECSRLLRDAEAKRFDLVLVYAIDRLSRYRQVSDPFLCQLTNLGIGFDSATENIDLATKEGRVLYDVKVAFAELESNTIEQRMMDGKKRIAEDQWVGRNGEHYSYWLGGPRPFGYKAVQIDRRSALVPSEDPIDGFELSEAEVVRMMFAWTTRDNIALQKIAVRLNAMGVPKHSLITNGPRSDDCWHYGNVARIIANPTYTGRFSCGATEQRIPPIVSQELFDRAQKALKNRRTYADRDAKVSYLLRGKIRCGLCGATCVGTPRYVRRGGKRERVPDAHYYVCAAKHQPTRYERTCANAYAPGVPIDDLVWADILDFVHHPGETLARLEEQLRSSHYEQSALLKELDELKRRADQKQAALKMLRRKLADDVITDAEYLDDRAEHQSELDQGNERITALEELLANHSAIEDHLHEADEFLATLELRKDWTDEEKRRLVELFVDEVLLTPDGIEVNYCVTSTSTSWNHGSRMRRGAALSQRPLTT
jgi:site-specific DNA recombinase